MLLQLVGRVLRVEHDGRVEEGEEHDHARVEDHVERLAVAERRQHRARPAGQRGGVGEAGECSGQQQQRRREDRRDDARRVELQRQVRGVALEHAVADLPLGILDQQTALRALEEDDDGDDHDRQHDDRQDQAGRQRAGAAELKRAGDGMRQAGDDAREDDQRDAVADAARGDLLAEPHQEHRAADQRDHRRDTEEPARIGDDAVAALQAHRDAVGLDQRQQDGAVAGVLVDDLAPLLAFLLQGLERGDDRRHQLHDDRRRDVGHDAQREDRHALHGAAREHVEHAEHAAALLLEGLGESVWVDAGQRDVGAEPIDEQRPEREPDALLQVLRLGEGRKIQVRGKLFGCRRHEETLRLAGTACVPPKARDRARLLKMQAAAVRPPLGGRRGPTRLLPSQAA